MVFRIGNLGDTVIALPAFNAIRQKFHSDKIILLTSRNKDCYVHAGDVLLGSGLIDGACVYDAGKKGLPRLWEFYRLRQSIKRMGIGTLVYLPPSLRTRRQVDRDAHFFKWCGILEIIGADHFSEAVTRDDKGNILLLPRETEFLLAHLERNGIQTKDAFRGLISRLVSQKEIERVDTLFKKEPGRTPMAVGIGGKGSAQKWTLEKYEALVKKLIGSYDLEPVVFGGAEDRAHAENLIGSWGRGQNFCGTFSVREAVEALKRCSLYLGNDTGTMHLAALADVPCVVIFSARANPGVWEPWGERHSVIRKSVSCEGCELKDCDVPGHPCMENCSIDEVFGAVEEQFLRLQIHRRREN